MDPKMLLTLLLYAYLEGKRSSRDIEQACRRDRVYRVICGGLEPDHATIGRFRQSLDDVIASLFAQVLTICAQAGLGKVGLVAVDGTKIPGAGSKEANRTQTTLEKMHTQVRSMLDEAANADATDDTGDVDGGDGEEGGGVRGSSLRRRVTERQRRVDRIEAALEGVAVAERRRVAEEKKRGKPKTPVGNVTDPESACRRPPAGMCRALTLKPWCHRISLP